MKLEKEIDFSISSLVDKYHESKKELPRPHLGVSIIGNDCERFLWLTFRWVVKNNFSGRILRLFRRGQLEENQIVTDLKNICIRVYDQQKRVNFNYHVSGSIDGIIKSGVPEAPNKEHLLEMKTYNDKRFQKLKKEGVEKSDPVYFVQMQAYMRGLNIDRALFYAVNKNDDEIYTERVRMNKEVADKYIERAQRIAISDRMPYPISTDATFYKCKMCSMHEFCHKTCLTTEVNCRTCAHSTPKENSTFFCERYQNEIPIEYQYQGCRSHVIHPDLVPCKMEEVDKWNVKYNGIINGEKGKSSIELLHGTIGVVKDVFAGEEVKDGPEMKRKKDIGIY